MNNPYQSPDVSELQDAEHQPIPDSVKSKIKGAVVSGSIVSTITLLMASYALISNNTVAGIEASNIIDALVYLGLTFGVYRKSRVCAVLIFSIFFLSKLYVWYSMGSFRGGIFAIALFYYFFRGILGTFEYHQFMKRQNENYTATSRWVPWVFIPTGILFSVLLVIGVLTQVGVFVPTEVLDEQTMPKEYITTLRNKQIIEEQEKILLFYSEGIDSILEGGNMISDYRVISYEAAETASGLNIYYAQYAEIESVLIESKGSYFEDSTILVSSFDGSSFYMLAPTEENGDMRMLNFIQNIISERKEIP